jgi:hypothetical protein
VSRKDVIQQMTYLADDMRKIQAKFVELQSMVAQLKTIEPPPPHACPNCGLPLPGERALAFHLANVHDGPPVPMTTDEAAA